MISMSLRRPRISSELYVFRGIFIIPKKELADYMGVQRPSLFRELKKLKDEGIIVIDNRTIQL